MKRRSFLLYLSLSVLISCMLAIPASAIKNTIGGGPIRHHLIRIDGGVNELLKYIENEEWENLSWYNTSNDDLHIKYLKGMDSELYLPNGYTQDDINCIMIDIISVWIGLNDDSLFHYSFVDLDEYYHSSNASDKKMPDEPLDTPFRFDLWDQETKSMGIEAYNIFEGDSAIVLDVDVDDPVECGYAETIPAFG